MQEEQLFDGITLQHLEDNCPVQYEVYVSGDGSDFGAAVTSGYEAAGSTVTKAVFPVQTARYVKVAFIGCEEPRQLAVSEMNVWNYGKAVRS
ncbi:F5/8 type C domain protein [compost metagenome]